VTDDNAELILTGTLNNEVCSALIAGVYSPSGVNDKLAILVCLLAQGFLILSIARIERALDGHCSAQVLSVDMYVI
jgi:hypothetical protein